MLFDTHCHPNLAKKEDKNLIIQEFFEKNPKWFLNFIWTNPQTNVDVFDLALKYDKTYCSIWIHPCDIYDLDLEKEILRMQNLILQDKNKKIIAIWECWLDYYWLKPENDKEIAKYDEKYRKKIINLKKDLQKIFFKAQINLAKQNNLPLVIHNREAKEDVFEILKETDFKNFIFHCYSENLDYAKKLLEFSPNCKISFSWIVTFKNAKEVQNTAKNIPLKNILVETDSPYLTPTPFRWKKENKPEYTKYVLEKIIELRPENKEEIEKQIFENSIEVFAIKN